MAIDTVTLFHPIGIHVVWSHKNRPDNDRLSPLANHRANSNCRILQLIQLLVHSLQQIAFGFPYFTDTLRLSQIDFFVIFVQQWRSNIDWRHHYTQSRLTTAIAVATCTIYTHYNIRPNYFRTILIRSEKISQVTSASTSNTPMLFYSCRPTILHRQFPRYSLSDWKSAEHRNYIGQATAYKQLFWNDFYKFWPRRCRSSRLTTYLTAPLATVFTCRILAGWPFRNIVTASRSSRHQSRDRPIFFARSHSSLVLTVFRLLTAWFVCWLVI